MQPNIRHSPRDGFNAYIVISSVHRLLATVRDNALARIARDTSIGVPGPHDFTSAGSSVRLTPAQRPSHPRPTCRDDRAQRPSARDGMAALKHNF